MTARWWLVVVIAGAVILRLATAGRLPLSGDEAYHWEWSRHLAGAYYDHPGMTAWGIWLATTLLPDAGELAVRLPAIVSSAVAALLACGLARDVARSSQDTRDPASIDRAGLLAAILVSLVPLPAALAVYMSTDAPLVPVCIGFGWAAFAVAQRGRRRAWCGLGLALGLALSTKFLVVPLVLGAAGWFVCSPVGRCRLRGVGPWAALLLAALASAPVWWWNATHDWMTIRFNFVIRQQDQPRSLLEPLAFVGAQLAVITPGVALLAVVALGRATKATVAGARLLAWMGSFTLVAFLVVSLRREVGVHWTMPGWGIALVVLAVPLAQGAAWTKTAWARFAWRSSVLMSVVAVAVAHAFALAPAWFARQDIVAGQPAKVARHLSGWSEVGRVLDARLAAVRESQRGEGRERGVFALSDQYGVAAALAFYAPSHPRVHLWSQARHGRNYEFWDDWSALSGQDAVLICKRPVSDQLAAMLAARFAVVEPAVGIPVEYAAGTAVGFWVVIARGFDGGRPYPPP